MRRSQARLADQHHSLMIAAIAVVLTLLLLGLWNALAPTAMTPKSIQLPGALAIAADEPVLALLFYLGDSLFVLIALWMFWLLSGLVEQRRWLITLGLSAAFLKAGSDMVENIGLAWPLLEGLSGQIGEPLVERWLWLLDLGKRIGGTLSALAFALLYPRATLANKAAALFLLATALFTAAGFLYPLFMQANAGLLFFAAAAIAWDARRHAHP